MTEQEKIYYAILNFLKSVKKDVNITDEILRNQFYEVDKTMYDSAIIALVFENAIGKNSPNLQWQITENGEKILNKLRFKLNESAHESDIKKKSLQVIGNSRAKRTWAIIVGAVTFMGLALGVLTQGFQVWDMFSKSKSIKVNPIIDIRVDPFVYNYNGVKKYDTGTVAFTIQTSKGSYQIQDNIKIDSLVLIKPDFFLIVDPKNQPNSQLLEVVLDNMILDSRVPEEIGLLKFKNNFILQGDKVMELYLSKNEEKIANIFLSIPYKYENEIFVSKKVIPIIVFNK